MKRFRLTLLVALAAVSFTARAQDMDPEMMSKMMPGEMHQLLAKHAGEWDVFVKFRMMPDQPMQDGKADCKAEMTLDGRFLKKVYKSEMMGQPFTVEETMGYDGMRGHFFEFTTESMSTSYMMVTGKLGEDGKTITMSGEGPDPRTGGTSKMKIVYKLVSDDEYVVEWWEDRGTGSEELTVQLTHKRK